MSNKKSDNSPLMVLDSVDLYYEIKRGLFKEPFRVGAAVDINLSINSGEVLAIVGESGCGKTTLGNVIIGMLKPTNGHIYFNDQDVYKMKKEAFKEFRNSVQLVQQDSYAALNPVKTL